MKEELKEKRLQDIPTDKIETNEQNPRTIFDEERLDNLMESISARGILVPVTVFEKKGEQDTYILLDGERRLRASLRLNRATVPARVIPPLDTVENIETMFHIHMEREQWSSVEIMRAVENFIEETGTEDSKDLARRTGLPESEIRDIKLNLQQPEEYQKDIENGILPFDFFPQLHQRFIEPLRRGRPSVFERIGEDHITKQFVERRRSGYLENVTRDLRTARRIIGMAEKADDEAIQKEVDQTIERVVNETDYPIDEAYEDVAGHTLETENFIRLGTRFTKRLQTLVREELSESDRDALRTMLSDLRSELKRALKALA